ncbi:PTS sugar transporter subunit IIA [candidate division KSB1 bacterium]|nr:PTS sugar transporter subunit IIA [candidate division KSB1 bacterium]
MTLRKILSEELIKIPLESDTKEDVIKEMVDLLNHAHKVSDTKGLLKSILDREKLMSTGVGDGVAIPHAKAEGIKELVAAFGITKHGIDFQSIDEKPVRLIFLLVGPLNQPGPHLKALSRISRLIHKAEFRKQLIASSSPREVMNNFVEEEMKYFDS